MFFTRSLSSPPPRAYTLFFFGLLVFGTFDFLFLYKRVLGLDNSVHVPYWSQIAWSFMHGHLDVVGANPAGGDLIPYHGRVYAYWPPLTAFLMMPIIALRGAADFPQRLFSLFFASLNAGLFYLVADRFLRIVRGDVLSWVPVLAGFFFGWGTSTLVFGVIANHWFLEQLTTSTMLLAALGFALDRRPDRRRFSAIWSACFFALAVAGRAHLVLAWPLWVYLSLSNDHFELSGEGFWLKRLMTQAFRPEYRVHVLIQALPLMVVVVLLAWYNQARFGHWWDNGLSYHNVYPLFQPEFKRYGCFSVHFIPINAYYYLLRLPGFERFDGHDRFMGFSLLLQSPILLLIFVRGTPPRFRLLAQALISAAAVVSLPIFMIFNPGASQFGARYLFDVVPFLFLLLMLKESPETQRWFIGLGLLSVVINGMGPLYMLGLIHF